MKTRIATLLVALALTVSSAWGATFNLFSPAAGILKGNPSTYVTTAATSSDVIATWSGTCNAGRFLRADGACSNSLTSAAQTFTINDSAAGADRLRVVADGGILVGAAPTGGSQGPGTLNATGLFVNGAPVSAGGGAVSSVALALPSVFTVTGSPVTAAGTLTGTFATGQPQNQVLATPNGSTGALGLRALVAADLPALGANPSATIGLSAVNGAATTYTRSDGAPALSQGIAPTWTATHVFANNGNNATFIGNDPRWNFTESDGGVDAKNWITRSVATGYDISTASDAAPFSAVNSAFNISRTGTAVERITLNGSGGTAAKTGNSAITAISGLEVTGQILNNDANPSLYINESDAPADEKLYRFNSAAGDLAWSTRTDANAAGSTWLALTRTGTAVDALSLTATAINLNGIAVSDYARLSQSNIFTGSTQRVSNTGGARVVLQDSDATADEQCFFTISTSSVYSLFASTDANCSSTTGATSIMRVNRTGMSINNVLWDSGTSRWLTTSSPAAVVSPTNANITSRSGGTDVVAPVQINGSAATESSLNLTRANGANTAGPIVFLNKSRGTVSAPATVVNSGDDLGRIVFSGSDSAAFSNGAEISAQVDGTPGANDMPGRLVFATTADGANSSTERLRIAANGAWGLAGATFGSSGNVLTSNGSGGPPTWQAVAGAGDAVLANNQTFSGQNTFSNATLPIILSGVDGSAIARSSDSVRLLLLGGSANNQANGARISIYGNTHATQAGDILLTTGNDAGSTIELQDDTNVTGTLAATTLTGAGSGITALNMANAGSGTLAVARGGTGTTTSTGTGNVVLSASPTLTGTATVATLAAATITGAGSGITALDAGNVSAGTLAVARGGTGTTTSTGTGNVVLSASPTLTGTLTAATVAATTLTGAGSGITALDAGNVSAGTLAVARGGTGTTTSTGTGSVVLSASPTLTGTATVATLAATTATVGGSNVCRQSGVNCPTGAAVAFGVLAVSGSACTLSVAYDSRNIASCTWNVAGSYSVNFTTAFTTRPACTVTVFDITAQSTRVSGGGTTSIAVNTYSLTSATPITWTATNSSFAITCMGG